MQGFLNLNKPFDWTSHDCVARVRKLLRLKRVGHAGTLDPAATGVLPIALGTATRLLQYLPENKAYKATIRLGVQTTTDDLQGEIITSQPCSGLNFADVTTAMAQFHGKIEQIPPIYSAIQVDGKRLYDLARKGEIVEVPKRTVEIFHTEILDWRDGDFPELDVAIACGSGTYIRAIARDLGATLETGGTLAALIRTASSGFHLTDSLTLTDLETQIQAGTFQPSHPDIALQHLPSVTLPAISAQKWCQGQKIPITLDFSGITRVYNQETCLLGIGKLQDSVLIPTTVLKT
ncbi:tRNA pseudouridine(55) synthase TruB [Nodularia sphaerocarpa]|uniref:tRNA pseudouridine(55) synthase TruB n=1 Tax=Nodularia sphaerocarpa TaxID=137816 RepID=UPI001EFA40DE|nr:tRNA pseudouridine(55) synthase TruB [Nodularia sphaerocarpa]MDB9372268.1 tRNA pseudouridine(55) synthase TruB [Nodularia sphaerocarpa CS-585]MDB9378263.1 tRNA pseudouridine(55) synthase TruB [Nodularia sphaerocarpa CS-585A2]ULP74564.1 tRNA pseudouridine synthase B [Nodularia sphaerocarpa UHCC 0038]